MSLLIFLPFVLILYFLFWRPQQQRVRRQQALIKAIDVGDRVVTSGGMIGTVVEVDDERMAIEVADGVVVEFLRLAVSRRLDADEPHFAGAADADPDEDLEEEYAEEPAEEPVGDGAEEEVAAAEGAEPVAGGAVVVTPVVTAAEPAPQRTDGTNEEAAAPAPGQDPH